MTGTPVDVPVPRKVTRKGSALCDGPLRLGVPRPKLEQDLREKRLLAFGEVAPRFLLEQGQHLDRFSCPFDVRVSVTRYRVGQVTEVNGSRLGERDDEGVEGHLRRHDFVDASIRPHAQSS